MNRPWNERSLERSHDESKGGEMLLTARSTIVLAIAALLSLRRFWRRRQQQAAPAMVTVFASGLNNPRGLSSGPDGNLYVAEGGPGGTTLDDGRPVHAGEATDRAVQGGSSAGHRRSRRRNAVSPWSAAFRRPVRTAGDFRAVCPTSRSSATRCTRSPREPVALTACSERRQCDPARQRERDDDAGRRPERVHQGESRRQPGA